MKKSFFVLFLIFIMSLGSSAVYGAPEFSQGLQAKLKGSITLYVGNPKAFVDGNKVLIDNTNDSVSPIIVEDKTLVPVRFISESLNAKVTWDESSQATVIRMNGSNAKFVIGSKNVYINGTKKQIDVPAQIINDRMFIPIRTLVEALGKKVFWDDSGVIIISDNEAILNAQKDKAYIDEIKDKNSTKARLISVPNHGDYILEIPNSWNMKVISAETTGAEITPKSNNNFHMVIGFRNSTESDNIQLDLSKVKQVAQSYFNLSATKKPAEKEIDLKELEGENIKGYYFNEIAKKNIEGKYKYGTVVYFKVYDSILGFAGFESNDRNSVDESNALQVLRGIKKVEKSK